MTFSDHEIQRYSRQTILKEFGDKGQKKLKSASVLVIGAGGLGVPVLQYLVAAGVGRIIIADHDKIDLSNLHRQVLYNENDIGRFKAEVAKEKLCALNTDVIVASHVQKISETNIERFVRDADIVIDGSDNFETRYLVNDACVVNKRPLVYGAVNKFEGQLAVLNMALENGRRSVHYRDIYPQMPEPGSVMNCAQTGVLGPVAGIIGSMMANEAIKVITETGEPLAGKMIIVDCLTLDFRTIQLNKESSYPINSVTANASFCLVENRLVSWNDLETMDHYLVDVRQAEEKNLFDAGGHLMPLDRLSEHLSELPDDVAVVFYCKTGIRSDRAVQIMAQLSERKDIFSVEGGIFTHSEFQG